MISAANRIQFNIEIFRNESLEYVDQLIILLLFINILNLNFKFYFITQKKTKRGFATVQPMVLPIAWMEESFEIDKEMASDLIYIHKMIMLSKLVPMLFTLISGLISIVAIILYLKRTGKVNILTTKTT